jgi:hypothetical protein
MKDKKKERAFKQRAERVAALAKRVSAELREEKTNQQTWVEQAYHLIRAQIIPSAPEKTIVTYGFPKGKRGGKHLGQCWNHPVENQQAVIFIHPCQWTAPLEVLDTLVHEMVHAATPGAGHKGAFKQLAQSIGMRGPMTTASAGPELVLRLNGLAKELDEFPAAGFDPPTKKQTSRLRLYQCACPIKVRVASDDFRALCLKCDTQFEKVESTMKGARNGGDKNGGQKVMARNIQSSPGSGSISDDAG